MNPTAPTAPADASGWIRTEYAPLDALEPLPDAADEPVAARLPGPAPIGTAAIPVPSRPQASTLVEAVVGLPSARPFVGPAITHASLRTRTGAQGRFMPEQRRAPRGEAGAHAASPRVPVAAPPRVEASYRTEGGHRAWPVAGIAAVAVLVGVVLGWRVLGTAPAAHASVALAVPVVDTPVPGARSNADTEAALVAAARAAAVPAESVRAASPASAARPLPAPPVAAVATATRPRESVAAAIARAQARADGFLADAPATEASGATAAP